MTNITHTSYILLMHYYQLHRDYWLASCIILNLQRRLVVIQHRSIVSSASVARHVRIWQILNAYYHNSVNMIS